MDKTAVIITHYKGEEDTRACLDLLLKENRSSSNFRLIVVDNSGSQYFTSSLKHDFPKVEAIKTNQNRGFAEGNNIGMRRALEHKCEYIILLNNDTLVTPDLVSKMILIAGSDESIGLVSPKIYFAPGFEYHKNRYKKEEIGKVIWYAGGKIDWSNVYASNHGVDEVDKGQFDKISDTGFATGCCMLVRREVIEKIGFLDKSYFLYFEDVDYSIRAKLNGFRVVYYPKAHIYHKNASSSEKPGSRVHIYYQTRNRLYFGYKYASAWTKKSLAIDSVRLFFKGDGYAKGVKDYYFGRMSEGIL